MDIGVALHGAESVNRGGPSTRAFQLTRTLNLLGNNAVNLHRYPERDEFDVVHLFNSWHPQSAYSYLSQTRTTNSATVFSPILLNFSEYELFSRDIPTVLQLGARGAFGRISKLITEQKSRLKDHPVLEDRLKAHVRRLSDMSNSLISLSDHETLMLVEAGVEPSKIHKILNPVDSKQFNSSGEDLFINKFGVRDYVLCVGRVEPRKNQALLALAMRSVPRTLVFIGHGWDTAYGKIVRELSPPGTVFVDRLRPGSQLLNSAYKGAGIVALPSWAEGAPLVALEGFAAGSRLLLSNRSAEREYFGNLATYCDPSSPESIAEALQKELLRDVHSDYEIRERYLSSHSYLSHAEQTLVVYETAIELEHGSRESKSSPLPLKVDPGTIWVDLTTLAHFSGNPTGIARVEFEIAQALSEFESWSVKYAIWNSTFQKFIEVDWSEVLAGRLQELSGAGGKSRIWDLRDVRPYSSLSIAWGEQFLVLGGAWMQNASYLRCLSELKVLNVRIAGIIHDVIPHVLPGFFASKQASSFSSNLGRYLSLLDLVFTGTRSALVDIKQAAYDRGVRHPQIEILRWGSTQLKSMPDVPNANPEVFSDEMDVPSSFILFVSTIDYRKNHRLLIETWNLLISQLGVDTPKLLIVGRKGFHGSDLDVMLTLFPRVAEFVIVENNVSDEVLANLYSNAIMTVYPSFYEGWGLPIAESLENGKITLASNLNSMAEIDDSLTDLLDPLDPSSWARRILDYLSSPQKRASREDEISRYQSIPWSSTAQKILAVIGSQPVGCGDIYHEESKSSNFIDLSGSRAGDLIDPISVVHSSGLGPEEMDGRWVVGTRADINFVWPRHPQGEKSRLIRIRACAIGNVATRQRVRVLIDGQHVGTRFVWPFFSYITVMASSVMCRNHATALLTLLPENPISPMILGISQDPRELSIKISGLSFVQEVPEVTRIRFRAFPKIWVSYLNQRLNQSGRSLRKVYSNLPSMPRKKEIEEIEL